MRHVLSALVVAAIVAGCVSPPSGGLGGSSERSQVPLTVTAARVDPGRCFDGAQAFGDVCHVFTVQVDNSARRNDLSTHSLAWKAVDTAGKVVQFGDSDADAVAGGAVATLRVSFTVPDGAPNFTRLRYDTFQAVGEAAIPAY